MDIVAKPQANLKSLVAIFIIFVLVDLFWNAVLSRPLWEAQVRRMTGKELDINGWAYILIYLLMAVGLNYLAYSQVNPDNFARSSIYYGILFGLVIQGVYNMSTLARFPEYNVGLAIVDTLWGMLASSLTLYIVGTIFLA